MAPESIKRRVFISDGFQCRQNDTIVFTPVFLTTREEDGFRLRADALAEAVTPRTRLLFLNYPCNPTGATYSRELLERMREVFARYSERHR